MSEIIKKSFSGANLQEAMKKAMKDMGDDISLIDQKIIRKKTPTQAGLYEIIVEKVIPPQKQTGSNPISVDISNAAHSIAQINNLESTTQSLNQTQASSSQNASGLGASQLRQIQSQTQDIQDNMKYLLNAFWEETKDNRGSLLIPPEFSEIYRYLKKSGTQKEYVNEIMRTTLKHMPLHMKQNAQSIKEYFKTLLKNMMKIKEEDPLVTSRKKVLMLVGPTGVGKTTTIAKLAARYGLSKNRRFKVGLIALDNYRIAAVEQLKQYSLMMKIGLEVAVSPPEFEQSLHALSHCDYILVDTMGSSPYDKERIEQIYRCLKEARGDFDIDVSLAMTASGKYEDLVATFDSFSEFDIDSFVFTKFDETREFGNVLSFLYKYQKPVSYFSIGQEVPDDLLCADAQYLVDCLFDGFKRRMR